MRHLTREELELLTGGIHINIGAAFGAIVGGFIVGGPIGMGMAIGTVLIAQGTNNLVELAETM